MSDTLQNCGNCVNKDLAGNESPCKYCAKLFGTEDKSQWAKLNQKDHADAYQGCDNCAFENDYKMGFPCSACFHCKNSSGIISQWEPKESPKSARSNEYQEGGTHYTRLSIQPWDAMRAWMNPEAFKGFLKGNCIKYLARDKNGLEDLKKARHYLDKLIEEESK